MFMQLPRAMQGKKPIRMLQSELWVTCWCTRGCLHAPWIQAAVDEPLTSWIWPAWRTRGVRTDVEDAVDATFRDASRLNR